MLAGAAQAAQRSYRAMTFSELQPGHKAEPRGISRRSQGDQLPCNTPLVFCFMFDTPLASSEGPAMPSA